MTPGGQVQMTEAIEIRFSEGPLVAGAEVFDTFRSFVSYIEDVPVRKLAKYLGGVQRPASPSVSH